MIVLSLFVAVIIGSLLTTLAMEGESKPWRKPLVMGMGLMLTVMALAGILAVDVCK